MEIDKILLRTVFFKADKNSDTKCSRDYDRQKAYVKISKNLPLTRFEQVARLYIEQIEELSVIKVPLVGPQIIDFESSATNLTKEQIQAAKNYYTDFIKDTVRGLIELGHKNPQNEEELDALNLDIYDILWRKFILVASVLLVDGLAAKRKYLDCNSSCYVVADILNQFGVKSKLVILPSHTILHSDITGISTDMYYYIETTAGLPRKLQLIIEGHESGENIYVETPEDQFFNPLIIRYKSEEDLKEKYRLIYGEYDYQVQNSAIYTTRGTAKDELKDYSGAIADYDRAIELDPKYAPAYNNRGVAKLALKDYNGAILDFSMMIELDPKHAMAYDKRGIAKYRLEDLNGAILDFNKAIELDPKHSEAYHNRGVIKYELKDFNGAIADYDKTIELKPRDALAYHNRGSAKYNMEDYRGAIADYDKSIKLDPKYAPAYYNRGVAKLDLEDYNGAIADYDKAIELDPKYADAYNNRGVAKYALEDYNGAILDFSMIIKLDPKYVDAYYKRGAAKYALEDYNGAILDFSIAIELNPKYADAYNSRGKAYSKLGRTTEAEQDFATYSKLKGE